MEKVQQMAPQVLLSVVVVHQMEADRQTAQLVLEMVVRLAVVHQLSEPQTTLEIQMAHQKAEELGRKERQLQ